MSNSLSSKEELVLAFIKKTIREKGYPPSVREIGQAVGLSSSSTVHGYLKRLEGKGYLRRDATKPRAMEVLGGDKENNIELISVPLLGRVAAGVPLLATENREETFPLPSFFTGNGEFFMLTVKGDSMVEAGILDGDMVVVRQQHVADNGEIVVALLDEEATVKRFFKENDRIRLQPENKLLTPIYARDVQVLGKVIGLLRKIH
ncbi:transcriptional repressor LexA [Pelotomaculum terephthalicicum JT]|uniref:transcriptional repressor LexA n=1 Tax=Pelotomaculum TaxID=191373 RepID=UPI0009D5F535|nr:MULTISPECIES: transcriptional repressor LexA [Pelotomaculum]MCG9966562.1 transcriptional repressor LexA [Pelotomaculum terephthalicicum JT]OPX91227.1 MAG: LexA repressor [Pelotomaculum sp. PtaB.Bin117]OPY63499.1 MAG: LexA repressor [Pelotomaculum sp. PtaU1.Bin065]